MLPNKPDKIKIVVIDDHPMFREGVVRLIEAEPSMVVVGTGGTALEAVQLAALHEPDIMLLDMNMLGGGVAATRTIQQSRPNIKILMLSMSEDQDQMMLAFRNGAIGYLLKGIGGAALLRAIQLALGTTWSIDVHEAKALLAQEQADRGKSARVRTSGSRPLTELETSWLLHAENGLAPEAIARELALDDKAASCVVSAILINRSVSQAIAAPTAVLSPVINRNVTRH